jgi:hypothetical protein
MKANTQSAPMCNATCSPLITVPHPIELVCHYNAATGRSVAANRSIRLAQKAALGRQPETADSCYVPQMHWGQIIPVIIVTGLWVLVLAVMLNGRS